MTYRFSILFLLGLGSSSCASHLGTNSGLGTCTANSLYAQVVHDVGGAASTCGQLGVYANRCATTCTLTTPWSTVCTHIDGSSRTCGQYGGVYANSCRSQCSVAGFDHCDKACTGNSGAATSCGAAGLNCVVFAGQAQVMHPPCADACTTGSVWNRICQNESNVTINCQTFGTYDLTSTVRYNQVIATSSHNSFDSQIYGTTTLGAILTTGVRSLELDIHNMAAGNYDWRVYHESAGSNCGGHLGACLADVKAWHDAHPRHEVITIFIETKDARPFANASVGDFEGILAQRLGAANIYTPANLLAGKNVGNLQAAVTKPFAWPTLQELRGKFIIVLMGHTGAYLNVAGSWPTDRTAFVMASYGDENVISAAQIPHPNNNIIFYNFGPEGTVGCGISNWTCNIGGNGLVSAKNVQLAGFVARVFRVNQTEHMDGARANHVGFPATNNYNSGGYRSKTAKGYPFQCHPTTPATCDTSSWAEDLSYQ